MTRSLPLAVLFLVAAWHAQTVSAQDAGRAPTEIYKCNEDGKAVYQDGLCASGPNKPLRTRDAKGVEAVKGRAPEFAPPERAPVAVIPYAPLKPMNNSKTAVGNKGNDKVGTTTCRTASGATYSC